jgi:hypothetical protein
VVRKAGFVPDQRRSRIRSANRESREPLRVFVHHLHGSDLRAARAVPAELDQNINRLRIALEHGFHGAVAAVRHPAGDTRRLGPPSGAVPEEDSLDATADDDPLAGQGELLLVVVVLGGDADA